jgi:hypothetical protein
VTQPFAPMASFFLQTCPRPSFSLILRHAKKLGLTTCLIQTQIRVRDSFASGFVHAYLCGRHLCQCLAEAYARGAPPTLQPEGMAGQPSLTHLSSLIRRYRQDEASQPVARPTEPQLHAARGQW